MDENTQLADMIALKYLQGKEGTGTQLYYAKVIYVFPCPIVQTSSS